jgi:predicted ABC-type ATPase
VPQLVIFAGPNGSGKSTFISQLVAGSRALDFGLPDRVINPDEYARAIEPLFPDRVATEAARAVLRHRVELLAARLDFVIETTLSGYGELRLLREARSAGYEISLVYIATDDPRTNLLRIERRREEQNRDVSAVAVLRRFERSLRQLSDAVAQTDLAYIYDNSGSDFAELARIRDGRIVWRADRMPDWATRALAQQLNDFSRRHS